MQLRLTRRYALGEIRTLLSRYGMLEVLSSRLVRIISKGAWKEHDLLDLTHSLIHCPSRPLCFGVHISQTRSSRIIGFILLVNSDE